MVNGFSKFNGEKKCAGTTDYPHTKKTKTLQLHYIQKLNQNGPRALT